MQMNRPQRIIGAVVVPALVFVGFWFLEGRGHYSYGGGVEPGFSWHWEPRDSWWAWVMLLLIIGAFEWLWWADGGAWAKCRGLWRQLIGRPGSRWTSGGVTTATTTRGNKPATR